MKKFILIAILIFTVLPFYGEQSFGTVYVQRKGKIIKTYNGKDFCNALNEAMNGDTLYLSKGIFGTVHDELTVIENKSVTLLGAGASEDNGSYIEESLRFKNGENDTIRMEGIKCWRIDGFSMVILARKCYFDFLGSDLILDRCYCRMINNYKGIKATNCIIDDFYGLNKAYFYNCDINKISGSYSNEKFKYINCIIKDAADGMSKICIFNTLINDAFKNRCIAQDGYFYNGTFNKDGYTTEWLKENNYLGTDGTVVGCYGGAAPYTLELNQKEIQVKDMKIDTKKRKGTISVSVE